MPFADPTKNEYPALNRGLWLLGALLVVVILRLWRLPETGPIDYDSVRNWQTVNELAHGDFRRLFMPGSPGFLVFYLPVAVLTRNYVVFQAINALLGVAALGFFAAWVARQAALNGWQTAGLVLLGGTGLLLTFSGRDFTTSSASLLIYAGLLRSHFALQQQPRPGAVLRVVGWLAAGLCITYKFLFLVPILVALELWRADALWRRPGLWARMLLVLAAPYVLFGALGVLGGEKWYRWLGFYVRVVVPKTANPAGRQGAVHLDVDYYFRYLIQYESLLLLLGLGLTVWLVWRQWPGFRLARARPLPLSWYLLVWAGCLLAGMSILIKAPRGLLFAYLPLAALAVLGGRSVLPGWALGGLLLAAVGQNVARIQQAIYAPLPTHYPQVAAWLRAHHATKVASTVGLGLAPYLAAGQQLKVISDERQLAALRAEGYQYVLLDGYWRVAGVTRFDSLRRQPFVAAWPAPQLQQPLLFLEHSEYTGLGYGATLAATRAAVADSLPLRLYRLR